MYYIYSVYKSGYGNIINYDLHYILHSISDLRHYCEMRSLPARADYSNLGLKELQQIFNGSSCFITNIPFNEIHHKHDHVIFGAPAGYGRE